MSRRAKDPVAAVIQYFKTAPLDAAEAVLGVCAVEVNSRKPLSAVPARRKTARKPQETQAGPE